MPTSLNALLKNVVERGGTDLHVTTNSAPQVRIDGVLRPLDEQALSPTETKQMIYSILTDNQKHRLEETLEIDFSFGIKNLARFRCNVFHQRGALAAAFRLIPHEIRGFNQLGLPAVVERLCEKPRGLVLVTGPTGSGKTTTLAAMLDKINRDRKEHIVTIEDPIEYEHQHHGGVVEQVEIGVDAPDFPTALRASLRQAPDIIVVGEMRDPETMRIALAAAETGHLVFSTVHTTDAASTVARIADSFPDERQNTIRQEMAMALAAVMTQTLLPKKGGGIIPAAELLFVGYGARQHIRRNALQHLHQETTITRKQGSFTFEESLAYLVKQGLVERQDALARAVHVEELEQLLSA
jgi:twitching motility protein PilT